MKLHRFSFRRKDTSTGHEQKSTLCVLKIASIWDNILHDLVSFSIDPSFYISIIYSLKILIIPFEYLCCSTFSFQFFSREDKDFPRVQGRQKSKHLIEHLLISASQTSSVLLNLRDDLLTWETRVEINNGVMLVWPCTVHRATTQSEGHACQIVLHVYQPCELQCLGVVKEVSRK